MIFREAFDPIRALGAALRVLAKSGPAVVLGGFLIWVCDWAWMFGMLNSLGQIKRISFADVRDFEQASRTVGEVVTTALSGLTGTLIGFAFLLGTAAWLFRCYVLIGFAAVVEESLVHEHAAVATLFKARARWSSMALTTLLCGLIKALAIVPGIAATGLTATVVNALTHSPALTAATACAVVLLYLPVIAYMWLGVTLAPYAVAVEGMEATEAIARSWLLVRRHRWQLFFYWLVMTVPRLFCFMDCCLLSAPTTIVEPAWVESYLRLVKSGEPQTWGRSAPVFV